MFLFISKEMIDLVKLIISENIISIGRFRLECVRKWFMFSRERIMFIIISMVMLVVINSRMCFIGENFYWKSGN